MQGMGWERITIVAFVAFVLGGIVVYFHSIWFPERGVLNYSVEEAVIVEWEADNLLPPPPGEENTFAVRKIFFGTDRNIEDEIATGPVFGFQRADALTH